MHIVHLHTRFGSQDPEDPPELAADSSAECFYIGYRPPGPHGQWHSGGMAMSLREATFLAQRKLGPILQWVSWFNPGSMTAALVSEILHQKRIGKAKRKLPRTLWVSSIFFIAIS